MDDLNVNLEMSKADKLAQTPIGDTFDFKGEQFRVCITDDGRRMLTQVLKQVA